MGHGAGDLAQALDSAEALGQGEDLGLLAESLRGGVAPFQPETEHAAAHAVAVLLQRDGPLAVRVQTRVVDGDDVGRRLQSARHRQRVLARLAGAEVQRLQAPVGEPAVERRRDGADGVLQEGQSLLELVRVEGRHAHDHVRVAVDVLCDGVHDDVGAVVQRVLHVGGQERVVDHDQDAVLVGDGGDVPDVDQAQRRVRRALDPDEFGLFADQFLDVQFDGRGKRHLHPVRQCDLCKVPVRPAVDVRHRYYVRARGEGLQDRRGRRGPGGERQGVPGVFEGGHGLFEVVAVRVRAPTVFVEPDGLAHGRLCERRGQGEWFDDGAGGGIVR